MKPYALSPQHVRAVTRQMVLLGTLFSTGALAIAAAILMAGCSRDVEPEHMAEMKTWADAVCACSKKPTKEAKACAAAHPPPAQVQQEYKGGFPTYHRDSYGLYDQVYWVGNTCFLDIQRL